MKMMKINKRKSQRGATLISWLLAAGLGILIASAIVKVAPYYVEFNNVKGLMKTMASEPSMKKANMRMINSKIAKYLNVNGLYALEQAYNNSRPGTHPDKKTKNPFTLTRLKKANKRILTVEYDVPQPWIGNLSFLINFKHAVVLGYPDEKVDIKHDLKQRKTAKLNLR
ncbi:MAG TPA: DUF4845 domain-containing protein [Leucothrix sp.]|nr:DUF4845 domain-containing protein [Leucothrix sp.]